ncbi:MAG: hypothetical protein J6U54_05295 [Clostridiales bacterium]|nr:hypothetical protein [Clostridiales bacterium]
MDTMLAFEMGRRARANGNKLKVFDWDMLANRIKDRIDEIDCVSAYLEADREWTGGYIFNNGKPCTDYNTYLASVWATPCFEITYKNGIEETVDCWQYEEDTPGWGANTLWPKSALDILGMTSEDITEFEYYADNAED